MERKGRRKEEGSRGEGEGRVWRRRGGEERKKKGGEDWGGEEGREGRRGGDEERKIGEVKRGREGLVERRS